MPDNDRLTLHELERHSWLVRKSSLLMCRAICLLLRASVLSATCFGRFLRVKPRGQGIRVVLTGRFMSDGWVEAHIRPLALSNQCKHVWVVTDGPMVEIPKTTYVCPPGWLQGLVGRAPARSLYCLLTAVRRRPHVIGGFHLLINGMVALAISRLVGARSLYFCVGGWTETWGGGARSESQLFRKIGEDNEKLEHAVLRFVKQVDLTLTMGKRGREYLRSRGVTGAINVMAGGIDPIRFTASDDEERVFDLVFVGRLVPIKRPDILLEVIAKVVQQKTDLRVAIVGDGPLRDALERQAGQMGITDNVSFIGYQADVAPWLRRARLFVLTSDSEGLALSVIEAMMGGLPVIVSDVGDLGDLVTNSVNGWRVPRRDVDGFSEKILALLSDDRLYGSFSQEARRAAMQYSVVAATEHWNRVLREWACEG